MNCTDFLIVYNLWIYARCTIFAQNLIRYSKADVHITWFTGCFSNNLLKEYDDVIRFTLQYVLNIALSDEAWNQASLPVASGGLGIRKATQVALPAFL